MDCEGSQHRTSILSKVLETRFVRQVPLYMQLKQTQTCTLTHSSFPFDLLFLSLPLHLCSFHHPQSVCSTFKDFFNAWIFSEKGVRFFFFLQRICLSQRSVVWFFFKDLQKKRRQSGTCECRPASSCALQNGDKLLHSSRSFHYTFSPADIAPSVTQGLLITCLHTSDVRVIRAVSSFLPCVLLRQSRTCRPPRHNKLQVFRLVCMEQQRGVTLWGETKLN